jgi:hypothetical protein
VITRLQLLGMLGASLVLWALAIWLFVVIFNLVKELFW